MRAREAVAILLTFGWSLEAERDGEALPEPCSLIEWTVNAPLFKDPFTASVFRENGIVVAPSLSSADDSLLIPRMCSRKSLP